MTGVLTDPDALRRVARERHMRRLWLFGSASRGDLRDDSDVDLIVEYEPGHEWDGALRPDRTTADFEVLVPAFAGRELDLHELGSMSPPFLRRLRPEMRLIYEEGHIMDEEPKSRMAPEQVAARKREVDHERLCHALQAAQELHKFADGVSREQFDADARERIGWTHLAQIIGEALAKVSQATRDEVEGGPPFGRIVNVRHRLVHDYHKVDYGVVYRIGTEHVGPLIAALRKYLADQNVDCQAMREPYKP